MKKILFGFAILLSSTAFSDCITTERIVSAVEIQKEYGDSAQTFDINLNKCFYQAKLDNLLCENLNDRCGQNELDFTLMSHDEIKRIRQKVSLKQINSESNEEMEKLTKLRWFLEDIDNAYYQGFFLGFGKQ